jgi:uncharacterized membrane protein
VAVADEVMIVRITLLLHFISFDYPHVVEGGVAQISKAFIFMEYIRSGFGLFTWIKFGGVRFVSVYPTCICFYQSGWLSVA